MTAFPGAEASFTGFTASHTLAADSHASQHNLEQTEIVATQHKIGTGASTPTSGLVLRGNGAGTSAWGQAVLTTDVSGVLPQANGGTGTTLATGTGKAVYDTAPTVSNPTFTGGGSWSGSPTITTPTIASLINANHDHSNAAGGGQLTGSTALVNSTVTANKLATGADSAIVLTSETSSSASFTDLATPGPSVTVTIGANGLALVCISSFLLNNTASGDGALMSFEMSGANTLTAGTAPYNLFYQTWTGNAQHESGASWLLKGLTPGSTTFKAKYAVFSGGTGTWRDRTISVVPL